MVNLFSFYVANAKYHPAITLVATVGHDYYRIVLFSFYLLGFVSFVLSLRGGKGLRYQVGQLAWTVLCLMLVVGQSNFSIRYLFDGFIWVLLPHGLIIFNDIMAYYWGVALGRRIIDRPLTSLSPNKTWEGFVGAMLSTVLMGYYVAPLISSFHWLVCPADQYDPAIGCELNPIFLPHVYKTPDGWHELALSWGASLQETVTLYPIQIHAVIFALFASLVAPFGGFLASAIKRAHNKKDFENIFPGHGGFMDRFDCQLLMSTFVYIYLTTFIKYSTHTATVTSIASQISRLQNSEKQQLLQLIEDMLSPQN